MKILKFLITLKNTDSFYNKNRINPNEFINSIFDGRKVDAKEYFDLCVNRKDDILTPSEYGCAKNHLICLKKFINDDADICLILEDDVEIIPEYKNLLEEIESFFHSKDVDLLHLGGIDHTNSKKLFYSNSNQSYKLDHFLLKHFWTTAGYAINKKAAQRIIDKQEKNLSVADKWSHFIDKDLNFYFVNYLKHPTNLVESSIAFERQGLNLKKLIEAIFLKLLMPFAYLKNLMNIKK